MFKYRSSNLMCDGLIRSQWIQQLILFIHFDDANSINNVYIK